MQYLFLYNLVTIPLGNQSEHGTKVVLFKDKKYFRFVVF